MESQPRHECRWTNCSLWTISATCATSAQQLDAPVDRRQAVWVDLSHCLTPFTSQSSRMRTSTMHCGTIDLPHKCRVCSTWTFVLLFILVIIIVLFELVCNQTLVEYFSQCIRSIWISYVDKTLCIWMVRFTWLNKKKYLTSYVLLFSFYFIILHHNVCRCFVFI